MTKHQCILIIYLSSCSLYAKQKTQKVNLMDLTVGQMSMKRETIENYDRKQAKREKKGAKRVASVLDEGSLVFSVRAPEIQPSFTRVNQKKNLAFYSESMRFAHALTVKDPVALIQAKNDGRNLLMDGQLV